MAEASKLISYVNNNRLAKIPEVCFEFYDKNEVFKLDLNKNIGSFLKIEEINQENVAGILPSEEFYFFLKHPWGADTLNITSCFEVKNHELWKKALIYKDQLYDR